jgi:hypothetical protein
MQCDNFRRQMRPYLAEELDGDVRSTWREHLRSCAECREWAVADEPTLLLASLPVRASDPRRVDACAEAVSALIRQERLKTRLRRSSRAWLAAAAAALVLTFAGLAWRFVPGHAGAGPAPQATPMAAITAEEPDSNRQPPPQVEVDMRGDGVRIYHFASDGDADTAVLFIVNPALES